MPSKDFIDIVKLIKKTVSKRDHKKVDFDRYTNSVKKLQDKKDKSANDEKSLIKVNFYTIIAIEKMCSNISSLTVIFLQAEEHLTKATEEYEYYNELVKKELPAFFEYRDQFIEPVVSNYYHLQLKIYRILSEKMERLISDTGYFDVQSDILAHYNERKVEVNQQIETHLTLLKNKKKSKKESKKF